MNVLNDDDYEATSFDETGSIRSHIEALEIGESYSRAVRLHGDKANRERMRTNSDYLRNSLQSTAFKITKRRSYTYVIEGGDFRTRSLDVIVTVVITRVT